MILTVTLNPAVDISYKVKEFSLDTVNRVSDVSKTAGGKGLNVSRVLQQLGEDVGATGFLGGSLGDFIRGELSKVGIQDYFVKVQGETRNCIAVIHEGQQTEILENGPIISESEATALLGDFSQYVQKVDSVTISGSLPKGLADDFYGKLIKIANSYDVPVLLDTKGELLNHTLRSTSKPFLIKPNVDELADLLGDEVKKEIDIVQALHNTIFAEIPCIVVTTGSKGAIVKNGENIYQVSVPKVEVVNPVGSGDSVIAGFAAGLSRGLAGTKLIKFGLAMGVLNVMEGKTGHINPDKIDWCTKQMNVERIGG